MGMLIEMTLLGVIAGTVTTSTAIGWGIITIPALLLYFKVSPSTAVGISVIGFILCAISVAISRLHSGAIHWALTAAIAVGGLIGTLIGTTIDAYVPAAILRKILGVMTIAGGITLVVSKS